jgi:hypothetical protein
METASFPATIRAVREAAALVQWAWIQMAEASALTPREQELYTAGLQTPQSLVHPLAGNALQAMVVNVAPQARRLEYGTPSYHLPERINWASARGAKRTRAGQWYMVIPFTHAAYRGRRGVSTAFQARMMASAVYQVARRLRPGQYITAGPTRRGGVHVPGLRPYVPRYARNIRPGYTHAAREERLVRRAGRGRGQSTYLTFRTMTQDSPGWWIPARPGVDLARQVQRDTAPAVRAIMEAGIRQDIAAATRKLLS